MRRIVIAALAMTLGASGAQAVSSGSGALALAALVGAHSPKVSSHDRGALLSLLDGHVTSAYPTHKRIAVAADSVQCRSSDVDIAAHDCTIVFGKTTRTFKGRAAHELYATLIENGVASDGAAGSIYEAVKALDCKVDFAVVKQKGGGGADCAWTKF